MTVRIAAFIWTMVMLVGTLMPKVALDDRGMIDIPGLDKVAHLIMYAGFVYLWSRLLSAKAGRIKGARIAFYVSIWYYLQLLLSSYIEPTSKANKAKI